MVQNVVEKSEWVDARGGGGGGGYSPNMVKRGCAGEMGDLFLIPKHPGMVLCWKIPKYAPTLVILMYYRLDVFTHFIGI